MRSRPYATEGLLELMDSRLSLRFRVDAPDPIMPMVLLCVFLTTQLEMYGDTFNLMSFVFLLHFRRGVMLLMVRMTMISFWRNNLKISI
jgi:hypothetical protein